MHAAGRLVLTVEPHTLDEDFTLDPCPFLRVLLSVVCLQGVMLGCDWLGTRVRAPAKAHEQPKQGIPVSCDMYSNSPFHGTGSVINLTNLTSGSGGFANTCCGAT